MQDCKECKAIALPPLQGQEFVFRLLRFQTAHHASSITIIEHDLASSR